MISENEIEEVRVMKELFFMSVSLGKLKSNNQNVIIKKFKKPIETKRERTNFAREVQILRSFNSPFIEKFIGFQKDQTKFPFIVSQFYKNGNLAECLSQNKLDITQRLIIASGIAKGMKILHTQCVIHRDLKPSNILLDDNFEAVISGFSFAKFFDKKPYMSCILGTPLWMAPELFEGRQYDKSIDVYAFAMILYQLITNQMPFGGHIQTGELMDKIFKRERPEIPATIPEIFRQLLNRCWAQNPKERPSFDEIIEILAKDECTIDGCDIKRLREYQKHAFSDIDEILAQAHNEYAKGNVELATNLYLKAADKGSSNAYLYLGNIHPNESIKYYKLAAEKGCIEAAVLAGEQLLNTDPKESVRLFSIAVEKRDPKGLFSLGICKIKGLGTDKDVDEGLKLLQQSAEKGNASAQFSLGYEYEHDESIEQNKEKALKYYLLASQSGHIKAIMAAANLSNEDEALQLYKKGSELGSLECNYFVGNILYKKGKSREAARYFRPAAEAGHTLSQYMCGRILYEGDGVTKDLQKAAVFLKYAADSGNADAAYLCGKLLAEGKGVKKDSTKAEYYLKIAADNGNLDAMYILGNFIPDNLNYLETAANKGHIPSIIAYAYKLDQELNEPQKAFEYFNKAAEQHDPEALCNLGVFYENGRGVEKDIEKAGGYYREAAMLGNSLAQYNYAVLLESEGNKDEAIKFFKMAADRNDPDAQLSYANLIAPSNIEEAAKYSHLSADAGNAKAQCLYGQLLYVGRGCEMNKHMSRKYIEASAKQGYDRAIRLIKELDFS